MNRLLLCVLCLLAVAAVPSHADTINGVLAEERVVNLPQDGGKWYCSIVGKATDPRYKELLGWFDTTASLKKLKSQVHFCPVTTTHRLYQERYGVNIKGLPTVRVQKASGEVVYEAAGKNLPLTPEGLYGAIATGVQSAQGLRLLPWRRDMENRCNPQPEPQPQPNPDPDPQPIDDGGVPNIEPVPTESDVAWLAVLCGLGLFGGLVGGYGKLLYQKMHPMK